MNGKNKKQLTTAQEYQPSTYLYNFKEGQMELFNNQIDRQLVNNAGFILANCKTALENGERRYLKPHGFTVNSVFRPTFANESSILTQTNQ